MAVLLLPGAAFCAQAASLVSPLHRTVLCRAGGRSWGPGGSSKQAPDPTGGAQQPVVPDANAPILHVPSTTSKPAAPLERSSYRRRRRTAAELREEKAAQRKEQAKKDAMVARWAEALKRGGGGGAERGGRPVRASVLLVDGYNVLHMEPSLTQLFYQRNTQFARAEMEKWIDAYARAANVPCLVVYDAMLGSAKQDNLERVSPWLTVVYSANAEADSMIVRQARQAHQQGAYKVLVVSGDTRIHVELMDQEHVVMLDAPTFVRHIKESAAGDTSGPEAWRSFWSAPRSPGRLTKRRDPAAQPHQAQQQQRAHKEEQEVVVARDAAELESELGGIVLEAQQRQQHAAWAADSSGATYLQVALAEQGGGEEPEPQELGSQGGQTHHDGRQAAVATQHRHGQQHQQQGQQSSRPGSRPPDEDEDDDDLDALLSMRI